MEIFVHLVVLFLDTGIATQEQFWDMKAHLGPHNCYRYMKLEEILSLIQKLSPVFLN